MPHEPDTNDPMPYAGHLRRPVQPGGEFNYGFSPKSILKTSDTPKTDEQRAMVKTLYSLPPEILQSIMSQVKLRGYITGEEILRLKEQHLPQDPRG